MAAGLGFKTFTTGEVLTAGDVNGYLMQGINVFASSAARAAAITSPQEGQYSFLKDTNALEYYDGAAWVGAPVGDITAVTAGTGISGGGSSGDVTITNSMATAIDAKADLIVGTGADTFSRLAVGTNGQVLTADSTVSPTGLKWATAASGGKVLQVVYGSTGTQTSTSSSSWSDTTLSATITPTSATSKVLVMVSQNGCSKDTNNTGVMLRLLRGATNILNFSGAVGFTNSTTPTRLDATSSCHFLDSPATTSATTYKTQLSSRSNVAVVQVQVTGSDDTSTMILMEIGA